MTIRRILAVAVGTSLAMLLAINANANIPNDLKNGVDLETAIINAQNEGMDVEEIAMALYNSGQDVEVAAAAMLEAGVIPADLELQERMDCSDLSDNPAAQIACLETLESPEFGSRARLLIFWFWLLILRLLQGGFPSPH